MKKRISEDAGFISAQAQYVLKKPRKVKGWVGFLRTIQSYFLLKKIGSLEKGFDIGEERE